MAEVPRARAALGALLRRLRERAGLDQKTAVEHLGGSWTQPRMSKIETGKQPATELDIAAWLRMVDATDAESAEVDRLRVVARLASRSFGDQWASGDIVADQQTVAEFERYASMICEYQESLIPAIAQTPDYARALMSGAGSAQSLAGATPETLEEFVARRIARQQVLYRPDVRVRLLLGEGALRRRYGPPEQAAAVLAAQLGWLVNLARLPSVELGVLPFDRPCPLVPVAALSLLDRVSVIETMFWERRVEIDDLMDESLAAFDIGMAAAVRGQDAVELIQAVTAELRQDGDG